MLADLFVKLQRLIVSMDSLDCAYAKFFYKLWWSLCGKYLKVTDCRSEGNDRDT